jgi:hypothetical protein
MLYSLKLFFDDRFHVAIALLNVYVQNESVQMHFYPKNSLYILIFNHGIQRLNARLDWLPLTAFQQQGKTRSTTTTSRASQAMSSI